MRVGAFHDPSSLVPPQGPAILRRRPNAIALVLVDQCDPATPQMPSQRITVVGFVGDHPQRLLPRTARVMTPPYAPRRERRFRISSDAESFIIETVHHVEPFQGS
jgi:hypothetical protein